MSEPTEEELAEARAWRHTNFPGIREDLPSYRSDWFDHQPRSHKIAAAFTAAAPFMAGFQVSVHDGLMLECVWCGVHDWRPYGHRPLQELFESALGHRQVCVSPDGPAGRPTR